MDKVVQVSLNSPEAKSLNITSCGTYEVNYYLSHGFIIGPKTYEEHHYILIVSNDYDHGNGD